jgi:hypothetical protein
MDVGGTYGMNSKKQYVIEERCVCIVAARQAPAASTRILASVLHFHSGLISPHVFTVQRSQRSGAFCGMITLTILEAE